MMEGQEVSTVLAPDGRHTWNARVRGHVKGTALHGWRGDERQLFFPSVWARNSHQYNFEFKPAATARSGPHPLSPSPNAGGGGTHPLPLLVPPPLKSGEGGRGWGPVAEPSLTLHPGGSFRCPRPPAPHLPHSHT